jgi:DNA processing protein
MCTIEVVGIPATFLFSYRFLWRGGLKVLTADLKYLFGLTLIPQLGNARIRSLLDYLGDPEQVWSASCNQLSIVPGIGRNLAVHISDSCRKIPLEKEWEKLHKFGINLVGIIDDDYPDSLRHIYNPPVILYYKGNLSLQDRSSIAIVGSRKASYQGIRSTEQITRGLVSAGFSVVSGLARGIDTAAHRAAVESGGRTVAVLGSGLNVIYPRENRMLAEKIQDAGMIISEYPLDTPPHAGNFPQRNRIISGLSLGVLVVEAGEKSGALITADFALEQGRDVFALPGNINSNVSKGSNNLIKQGAKLVTEVNDILEEYGHRIKRIEHPSLNTKLAGNEEKIFSLIDCVPISLEQIIENSDLKPETVIADLLGLELKGLICQLPGKHFIRKV